MSEKQIEPRGEATLSMVDGHIRFTVDQRLDDDEYRAVKQIGLHWQRIDQAFKGPWSPTKEDFLRERFGVTLELAEIDLVEQAERRAEAYHGFADNAQSRADAAYQASHDAVHGIPLGQPILVGHHSECRHRRALARSWSAMGRSVGESDRAAKWARRARSTLARAQRRQEPPAIYRRIQEMEAEQRKYQMLAELGLEPNVEAWMKYEGKTADYIAKAREKNKAYARRWLDFLEMRLAYERAALAKAGGLKSDRLAFEVGGAVKSVPWGWETVTRVNAKSVSVLRTAGLIPPACWKERRTYDQIVNSMSKEEWQALQARAEEKANGTA